MCCCLRSATFFFKVCSFFHLQLSSLIPCLEQDFSEALFQIGGRKRHSGCVIPANELDGPGSLVKPCRRNDELRKLEHDVVAFVKQYLPLLFIE